MSNKPTSCTYGLERVFGSNDMCVHLAYRPAKGRPTSPAVELTLTMWGRWGAMPSAESRMYGSAMRVQRHVPK